MVPTQTPHERSERFRLLLILFLAADGVFVALHLVHLTTPYLSDLLYSIETDGGFAEWFQYTKELWTIILAVIIWRRTGRAWIVGWILAFVYFLVDDAISVHEIAGDIAYRHLGFGPALGLRAQDFGELLVTGLTGVSLSAIIFLLYRRANENDRVVCRDLAMLILALVTFGVGLDMLHSMLPTVNLRLAMGLIEDGGEMVTMSVTCWYLLTIADQWGAAPVPSLATRVRAYLHL
jgi:hypothetical protein